MKIIVVDGDFNLSREFGEHPSPEEAVFTVLYLLSKVYSSERIKESVAEVLSDI